MWHIKLRTCTSSLWKLCHFYFRVPHTGIKPVSAGLEAAAQSLYQWDLIYCEHKWTSTIILLIRRIKNHMLYVLRECLLMFLCLIKSTSSITKFEYIDTTNNLNTYSGRDAISVPHLSTTKTQYTTYGF